MNAHHPAPDEIPGGAPDEIIPPLDPGPTPIDEPPLPDVPVQEPPRENPQR